MTKPVRFEDSLEIKEIDAELKKSIFALHPFALAANGDVTANKKRTDFATYNRS